MQMMDKLVNIAFSFFMWMLMEPTGRTFFWAAGISALVSLLLLCWITRDE